ncbi:MAG: tetratricopeptide repeat protein, partial [Actinomycetota bacterium]
LPLFEEALTIAREVGDPTRIGEAVGYALLMKRDIEAAPPLLEEVVAVARTAGTASRPPTRWRQSPWSTCCEGTTTRRVASPSRRCPCSRIWRMPPGCR